MTDPTVQSAYSILYTIALVVIGLLLLTCLIRAIRGPRTSDRVIAINMLGTLTVIVIAIFTLLLDEGYLTDVAMIYTMLSFLSVVLLTKIYVGIWRGKHQKGTMKEHTPEETANKEEVDHA